MADIATWSTTAASNNSASPNGFPENMAPSGLNDSAREVMAAIAKLYTDLGGNAILVSGGSANAQTLTTTQTHAALDDMALTVFRAGYTNTGAATMAVDGLTAKNIYHHGQALTGYEIVAGNLYVLLYDEDGDNYEIVNPSATSKILAEQATTSGTAFDFTIPSWATEITVMFAGVSLSGTDNVLIQLGDAGGVETTGYLGASSRVAGGSSTGSTFTTGFGVSGGSDQATIHGAVRITLQDRANFTWVASGTLGRSDAAANIFTGGSKSTSAEATTVRVTRDGTNTFDAGAVSVSYR